MTVNRMDNVGIVVANLDATIQLFTELGLTLEGRMRIDGEWAGRVTGVRGQRVEIAMMRTPDGHSRLELSRFDAPAIASDHRRAPVNSLGYLMSFSHFRTSALCTRLLGLRKGGYCGHSSRMGARCQPRSSLWIDCHVVEAMRAEVTHSL